jgi:hypothetical protein
MCLVTFFPNSVHGSDFLVGINVPLLCTPLQLTPIIAIIIITTPPTTTTDHELIFFVL